MKPNLDELGGLYSATLEEYLLRGTEAALHRSYELGRQALTEGLGVLEMIALHQRAMGKILLEMATPEKSVEADRKSTRLNSSHLVISYAVFCLKKKKKKRRVRIK